MKVPRSGVLNGTAVLTGTARRVARLGWVWLRDPEARREERAASSLVVFIMFFPLIVGAFGFGIDISKNIWVRTSIQNAVDSSAVGGAGVTVIDKKGVLLVDQALAPGEMRKLYALNRADNPGLSCNGDRVLVKGTSEVRCWTGEKAQADKDPADKDPATGLYTRTLFAVHEESKNAFLGFLGQPIQNYWLQGKAKVSRATE
jgi:hypothetical protein